MQVYQERRKIHRFLRSRAVLAVLSIFALFLLVASVRMSYRAYRSSQARDEAKAEYERLLAQKGRIDGEISDLNNPEKLAKEAKRRFNVTAPGERVLIIVDRAPASDQTANTSGSRVWRFIKGIFD